MVGMLERRAARVGRIRVVPERDGADEGRDQRAVGGSGGERSAAAVALRGQVDHVGTYRADVLVPETPSLDDARTPILDDDVGGRAESEPERAAFGLLQIEAHALMAPARVVEHPRSVRRGGLGRESAAAVRMTPWSGR